MTWIGLLLLCLPVVTSICCQLLFLDNETFCKLVVIEVQSLVVLTTDSHIEIIERNKLFKQKIVKQCLQKCTFIEITCDPVNGKTHQ